MAVRMRYELGMSEAVVQLYLVLADPFLTFTPQRREKARS